MITKKCVICGKLFKMERNKKTCSPECSKERHRQTARAYEKKHHEKVMAAKSLIKNTCIECGRPFLSKNGRTYCSDLCRYNANNRRSKEKYQLTKKKPKEHTVTCGCCGKKFKTTIVSRKYCSAECGEIMKKRVSAEHNRKKRKREQELLAKRIVVPIDGIDAVAAAARDAGMSYGQLKAMEFLERQERIRT